MVAGSRSEIKQNLLFNWGLSPMVVGGGFKAGIPRLFRKGLLKKSNTIYHCTLSW